MPINDIVYIFGRGSLWDNKELRYSLRGIAKFFLNYGKVYVVGERLPWFAGITVIPAKDPYTNKSQNGVHKLMVAAKAQSISDEFILMNDDFIFINPCEEIKPYYKWDMEKTLRLHPTKNGYYYHSLKNTKAILETWGHTGILDWEVHYPVVFNKQKLADIIAAATPFKMPFLVRTLYHTVNKTQGIEAVDFKINNLTEFAYQKLRNPELISTSDLAVGHLEVQRLLARALPLPCKFEGDGGGGIYNKPAQPGMALYAAVDFEFNGVKVYKGNIIPDKIVDGIMGNSMYNDKWRQG